MKKVIICLKNIPWYVKWSVFMDNRKEWDDIYFNWSKLSFIDCNWIDYTEEVPIIRA